MEKAGVPFGRRIEENIKNYTPGHLYHIDQVDSFFEDLKATVGLELLLTDRHGLKMASAGKFPDQIDDVVNNPGVKIRIANRTIGHLYVRYDGVAADKKEAAERLVTNMSSILMSYAQVSYLHNESVDYIDELEAKLEKESYQVKYHDRNDVLTGTLNRTYFENRVKIVERSEVIPVGILVANINDWKFVNDNYGIEESDRLIQTVAQILKKGAKKDYVIGRVEGDVFHVMIPMVEDGEMESYCESIRTACESFADEILAPSVALGYVTKVNVEEQIEELFSDAEYLMLENKLEIKQAPGYQERLRKGIK